MSVLIAYKRGDTVYMGTDTRVIINEHKKNELCESNYKIQKSESGVLVGISADRKVRQILFAYSDIFTLDKNGELTRKHIVKEIIPNLLIVLQREGLLIEKDDELPYMKAVILLAHKGVLYEICSGFTIVRYEDFQALGKASAYTQAVMLNVRESDDVNEQIIKALDISAHNSHLVGAPYLLIDTKTQNYKLVKGE